MNTATRRRTRTTVEDVARAMDTLAPPALAQSWDNIGLLVGDRTARVGRVLLCIDLTQAVVEEARAAKTEFIVAYHPPIFKPITSLGLPSTDTAGDVFRCIRYGIAIYSPHTALDAAQGGTNDVMADLCGIDQTEPLAYVEAPGPRMHKLVVLVPEDSVERVAEAVFAAGAGHIGDYSRCSYRLTGRGTFLGGASTHPAIGRRGRMEFVDEVRFESVVADGDLPAVVDALRQAHPYEEPPFDVYSLRGKPVRGIGRRGRLGRRTTLSALARKLKRATQATCVQLIGSGDRTVDRAVIVVGSAGNLPFRKTLTATDVVITGEIRHHDGLAIARHGCTAIALGHWASERPVLPVLAERLRTLIVGLDIRVSKTDRDPFGIIGSK